MEVCVHQSIIVSLELFKCINDGSLVRILEVFRFEILLLIYVYYIYYLFLKLFFFGRNWRNFCLPTAVNYVAQ